MTRYVYSARLLHWLMAALFLVLFTSGYAMVTLVGEDTPLQDGLFGLHISTGLTILFLFAARILTRLRNSPPAFPQSFSNIEKKVSHLAHLTLYFLPLAAILIGWVGANLGGHTVHWIGIPMPTIVPAMETFMEIELDPAKEFLHKWIAYGFLVVIVLHILAVIKHRWLDGHDIMHRMSLKK